MKRSKAPSMTDFQVRGAGLRRRWPNQIVVSDVPFSGHSNFYAQALLGDELSATISIITRFIPSGWKPVSTIRLTIKFLNAS